MRWAHRQKRGGTCPSPGSEADGAAALVRCAPPDGVGRESVEGHPVDGLCGSGADRGDIARSAEHLVHFPGVQLLGMHHLPGAFFELTERPSTRSSSALYRAKRMAWPRTGLHGSWE